VVDSSLHWHDPAVQELLWLDQLAAKVVDHQNAAVRLT
jgi:hypothetical protein